MMERKILFTPGPVMISPAVKESLLHPETAHRRPAFEALFRSVSNRLLAVSGADNNYAVALVTGSGSAANECALSSLVRPTEEVVVVANGPFGDRFKEILACHGIRHHVVGDRWGVYPDVRAVERALREHPAARWLAVVWHETGSGMRNPVPALCEVAHRLGRRTFVDCVSALGAEDIHLVRDHVDVATSVGNKALGAITGVSYVICRRDAVPPLGPDMPRRTMYLSLQNHLRWADEHAQTPNTPAVTAMVALDTALAELLAEGVANRVRRVAALARTVRDGVRALGWGLLLPEEQSVHALTSVLLPQTMKAEAFIDALDARGFVLYPGKGVFQDRNVVQVAVMGHLSQEDCRALLKAMREVARELERAAA
ncbi:MAG: alanine--glyoxylate aminotransferase family protein [Deltaproteobacteria bacterium]|nr:alanine--glyoxylate aminotransferase family protein [Deltaproteobacteria bacterium]